MYSLQYSAVIYLFIFLELKSVVQDPTLVFVLKRSSIMGLGYGGNSLAPFLGLGNHLN